MLLVCPSCASPEVEEIEGYDEWYCFSCETTFDKPHQYDEGGEGGD
jgi:ribosomal protein L37AE/L43A